MTTPHPTDPQAVPPRQLRRSNDRMLAGVCGGVAEYLGVSANLVRVVTILFLLMGHGVLLYFLGWLLLPNGDGPSVWAGWRSRHEA
ncbi:MAG: PspC domain-containing protein [Acidimicrobiia bacterium]|nr:PspC domain-containing protein [Acidimicrobiia bacterium]